MKNLKEQLIRLGHQKPELRQHIKPVLDKIATPSNRVARAAPDFDEYVHQWEEEVARYVIHHLPVKALGGAPRIRSSYLKKEILLQLKGGSTPTITIENHYPDDKLTVDSSFFKKKTVTLHDVDIVAKYVARELEKLV